MADEPTYVLDANVFIEASRRYYAFDLAPRFKQGSSLLLAHNGKRCEELSEAGRDKGTRAFSSRYLLVCRRGPGTGCCRTEELGSGRSLLEWEGIIIGKGSRTAGRVGKLQAGPNALDIQRLDPTFHL